MIVTTDIFHKVVEGLTTLPRLAVDTETTGLRVWGSDTLFSIIISEGTGAFYFNFQDYGTGEEEFGMGCLLPRSWITALQPIFNDQTRIIYMHNAKFDMGMLAKEGIVFNCEIHCTQAIARVERNDHLTYDLSSCAKRIGEEKLEVVEEYIKEHDLWKWEAEMGGKKTRTKLKFFNKVPLKIMQPYAERDALITYKLGTHQEKEIQELTNQSNNTAVRPLTNVLTMERKLTKTCFNMEKRGVLVDRDYCREAIAHEEKRYKSAALEFKSLTGIEFVDSGKALAVAFSRMGEEFPTTDKGNPSFTDDVLQGLNSPVARIVQEYRDAYKRCNTYFRSFLYHADGDGFIHPNMRQGGTATGRFSYSEPNFQNLTKEEDGGTNPFPVRRAIIPPEDFIIVSIDYDQQEFRLMLDYAGEMELIKKIIGGYDPHQSTADIVGCGRRPAKILNFGLLYGMGVGKLAVSLGCSEAAARTYKEDYFEALPKVKKFIRGATITAERRKFVFTWFGRRLWFPDAKFAYKAANGIIQGGCADVAKVAMNKIDDFLVDKKSYQAVQVHDELLFMVHKDELGIVPELVKIMGSVYPYKHIPLTCSPSFSLKSWGEMTEGEFDGKKEGDNLQGQHGEAISKNASQHVVL